MAGSGFRIKLQRYRKVRWRCFSKGKKRLNKIKHAGKTTAVYGSCALISILSVIKVFCTHSSIHGLVWRPLPLVREALAGFLPAAGGAPLVLPLHAVDFTAFLGLATALPVNQTAWRQKRRGEKSPPNTEARGS